MTRFYTYKRQVVLHAGEVLKFMKGKGYYAAIAGVIVIGGGVIGKSCACIIPIQSGGGAWTPVSTANIKVTTTGNDSTCTRHSSLTALGSITDPCATLDKANTLAQNGDTVAVMGGSYPVDGSRIDSNPNSIGGQALLLVNDNTRTSDATFACGDTTAVTTPARFLLFVTQHVDITGGCFNFHKVLMGDLVTGYWGSGKVCTNETVNAAHMDIFNIAGPCNNIAVTNSTIGPSVACYASGTGTTGQQCHANGTGSFGTPTYTGEQYYLDSGSGNNDCCTEPKVHDGGSSGSVTPENITITGNQFYGFSSRDPDGGPHAGCLWLGDGAQNVTVTNNTFGECMTYMILFNDSSVTADVENNTMSTPKDAIRTNNDFTPVIDEPGFQSVQTKCSGGPVPVDIVLKNNTGMTGWYFDPDCSNTYSGTIISGNTAGSGGFTAGQNPSQPFSS